MQSSEILPFSSDIANELNEMVLSQGMLDLRSFGYGHRYTAGVKKKNRLELCLKSFGLVSYYYGREAGLELREDVETVIEPGMVGSKFLLLVNQIILVCRWFLWSRW